MVQHMPEVPKALIEYLEGICPEEAPSLKAGEREIWWNAGKVDLVRHLRSLYDEQNETILKGD